jgi:hypothetical protein
MRISKLPRPHHQSSSCPTSACMTRQRRGYRRSLRQYHQGHRRLYPQVSLHRWSHTRGAQRGQMPPRTACARWQTPNSAAQATARRSRGQRPAAARPAAGRQLRKPWQDAESQRASQKPCRTLTWKNWSGHQDEKAFQKLQIYRRSTRNGFYHSSTAICSLGPQLQAAACARARSPAPRAPVDQTTAKHHEIALCWIKIVVNPCLLAGVLGARSLDVHVVTREH